MADAGAKPERKLKYACGHHALFPSRYAYLDDNAVKERLVKTSPCPACLQAYKNEVNPELHAAMRAAMTTFNTDDAMPAVIGEYTGSGFGPEAIRFTMKTKLLVALCGTRKHLQQSRREVEIPKLEQLVGQAIDKLFYTTEHAHVAFLVALHGAVRQGVDDGEIDEHGGVVQLATKYLECMHEARAAVGYN